MVTLVAVLVMKPDRPQLMRRCRLFKSKFSPSETFDGRSTIAAQCHDKLGAAKVLRHAVAAFPKV
jgi:hypothetical protein